MNHYKARQHQETGKWKYTIRNDDKIYEVGYCADEQCPGHDTPEEACEHYKQYCLDNRMKFVQTTNGATMRKCQECGELTSRSINLNHIIFDLCEKHQTREIAEKLFFVGESWSSY